MKPTTLFWCGALLAGCASVPTPSPAPTADQQDRLARARALLPEQPVEAIEAAEALLAEDPELRPARLVAAEGSLRLARAGRGQVQLHLIDAANGFDRALAGADDADHPEALQLLAECRHDLGEFEAARTAALRAANGFMALDLPERRQQAANALLLAGKCDLQRFVTAREAEKSAGAPDSRGIVPFGRETQALAAQAGASFEQARRALPAEATLQLALLHQWLEQPAEVLRELERGLQEAPAEQAIHDAYIAWMRDNGQTAALPGAYARLVRERPTTTILRWHLGRALFERAERLRTDGNFAGALAAYEKADATFAEYAAMVPAHADGAAQWRASCRLAMSRAAIDAGDLRGAEQHLLAAADAGADASATRHFTAAAFALHVALAESGADALARTLAFNEELLRRFPGRWGFLYNNAALAARDLGVQKSKAGDAAAARELWERAYRHYEQAVELSPDDARIVNDCGLMLIYHLDRDFDRARALFERAIELGRAQLAALPADAPVRERELLEEAVGDAHQNIAVLQKEQLHRPFAEYREHCEEAVKYYPYQRREAAALLRNEGAHALASTARADTAARLAAAQGGAAEALAKRRAEIDAKAAAGDFDGALLVLDELAKDCKDHAPYQLLKGELNLKLAAQARETGRSGVELFYQDAISALTRAVELDPEPVGPRQLLAQAQYENGDVETATRTLQGLLLHLQSQGGGKPEDLAALHALRANAAARAYAGKKQGGGDDPELLAAARASFRFLEEQQRLDAAALQVWSSTEQWAGAPAAAVDVYVRALRRAPDDQALLNALLEVAAAQQQLPVAIDALAARTDATGLWFLGKARFWLADTQRQSGKNAEALATLDDAAAAFRASMQKNPDYRDSCEQWLAMCLGKKGAIAIATDDAANAEKWLLEAVRARPDRIVEDLGGQDTTKRAILFLIDKHMRRRDLAKVESIARAVADAANSDVDLLNNAGLFARDLGNQLEAQGKVDAAKEMYEQSYKAYRRAQELDPANVRLRNDCALIAIYHLERDWELARQLLDAAIADGDAQLRDAPPADANEKEQLEEAVGDCYENLALWHLKHGGDAAAAKAAAQQSMKYHPRERRPGARRHLAEAERRLQGK